MGSALPVCQLEAVALCMISLSSWSVMQFAVCPCALASHALSYLAPRVMLVGSSRQVPTQPDSIRLPTTWQAQAQTSPTICCLAQWCVVHAFRASVNNLWRMQPASVLQALAPALSCSLED